MLNSCDEKTTNEAFCSWKFYRKQLLVYTILLPSESTPGIYNFTLVKLISMFNPFIRASSKVQFYLRKSQNTV